MKQPYLILSSLVLLLGALSCSKPASPAIEETEVSYVAEGVTYKGHLAVNTTVNGKRPGVLVVHEWWGLNDHARNRARMLAELGYTALAVDMFGEGKQAAHPEDAGRFAGEVFKNLESGKNRFLAAMELLKKHETVEPSRIGAIGFCFGGGVLLHMARMGVDLKGIVSFHGSLATQMPAQPGRVRARILVCNGGDDPFVSREEIENFLAEMANAGAHFTFSSYPGAVHGFTNPAATDYGTRFNLPLAYNAAADSASWSEMKQFFADVFAVADPGKAGTTR